MRSLKAILGLAVVAFMLSGCGGGPSPASNSSVSFGSSTAPSSSSGSSNTPGSATLKWQAPTSNTNGSALTDLAGYYIFYGNSAGSMMNKVTVSNPGAVSYVIKNLSAGTWYFGIEAYTNTGLPSAMSNVGSKTIT